MQATRYSSVVLFRRLLHQARPYWVHISGLLLLSMFATPLALLVPLPLKIAVDSVIDDLPLPAVLHELLPATLTQNPEVVIILIAAFVVGIALLTQLQKVGHAILGAYTGEQLALGFRSQLFQHAQRLSLLYHDTHGAANSTFRIQYDAPAIQWILIDGIAPFVTALFTLVGMICVTLWIDWQLALVALRRVTTRPSVPVVPSIPKSPTAM